MWTASDILNILFILTPKKTKLTEISDPACLHLFYYIACICTIYDIL